MIGLCAPLLMFEDVLDLGFDYLEIKCSEISKIKPKPKPFYYANSFIPADKALFKDEKQYFDSVNYCCDLLSISKSKGIKHITLGSGIARNIPNSATNRTVYERWKRFLKTIDYEAYMTGVFIGLEPLVKKETNFINTFLEAQHWIETLKLKSFGITFDTYHIYHEMNDLDIIKKTGLSLVSHIHMSNNEKCYPKSLNEVPSILIEFIKNNFRDLDISIESVPFLLNDITPKIILDLKYLST